MALVVRYMFMAIVLGYYDLLGALDLTANGKSQAHFDLVPGVMIVFSRGHNRRSDIRV
jgi:hypothetical protein